MKIIKSLWVSLVILLVLSTSVAAETCPDIEINLPYPNCNFILNDDFIVSINYLNGTPSSPWGNYTNATINPNGLENITNPLFIDLTTLTVPVYEWYLRGTNIGIYEPNITIMDNNGSICTLNRIVNIIENKSPLLEIKEVSDVGLEIINVPFNFNVTLENKGDANATNISILLDLVAANATPVKQEIEVLEINDSIDTNFNITSLVCGVHLIRVQANYFNEQNKQLPSIFANDTYNVTGPDLIIDKINISPTENPIHKSQVLITVDVKNIGGSNSSGFIVDFYRSEIIENNKIGSVTRNEVLEPESSKPVEITWTVSTVGNYSIHAIVTSLDMECDSTNNNKTRPISVISSCGDGYCNGGESCSSCSKDCGLCPSSGGGGAPLIIAAGGDCTVEWQCSDWSECSVEGIQTRTCINNGSCPADYSNARKPEESRACKYIPPTKKQQPPPKQNDTIVKNNIGTGGGITGLITAKPGLIALSLLVIILAILMLIYRKKYSNAALKKRTKRYIKKEKKK